MKIWGFDDEIRQPDFLTIDSGECKPFKIEISIIHEQRVLLGKSMRNDSAKRVRFLGTLLYGRFQTARF